VEGTWLDAQRPIEWHEFETACADAKEVLERLAGDRSLFRRLVFTAHEREGVPLVGAFSTAGGEVELLADEDRGLHLYLHVGLATHEGVSATLERSYAAKVLSGVYRHVWSDGSRVAYATDEQPPGLYGMRRGLDHSLSWTDSSSCLVLREGGSGATTDGGLNDGQYRQIQNRADLAGVL